ncbi:hypothetical protein [Microvirga massiliensis]|uniref:hypothetical protein n=1 Tax=Microvirga massiliensis TaxID=1033741 RepID=UPI00062B91D2|nr:hypothetical protein [Microvirga massiliensis]
MDRSSYEVQYSARLQVELLPESEKADLDRLFADPERLKAETLQEISEGRFVARLGSKRVLWRRTPEGKPEVLGILDRSYAA